MTVERFMSKVDARIFKSPILRAVASFGAANGIEGAFFQQPRIVELPSGATRHVDLSFECHYHAELDCLRENDPFTIEGYGCFRFLYELLPGGDESGLTVVALGARVDE